MEEELISSPDVAQQLGVHPRSVLRVYKRLGIETIQQRDPAKGNQLVTHIRVADLERVAEEVARTRKGASTENDSNETDELLGDTGFFYLIQLEKDHDPGRFKVGFAVNVADRLRQHRCSAPFAKVVKSWPCRRAWERTAIDCVTVDCEQLHTEVFRTESLEDVIARCDAFFELMPPA